MQNLLHVELKIFGFYGGVVNTSCLASAALILVHVLVLGGRRGACAGNFNNVVKRSYRLSYN